MAILAFSPVVFLGGGLLIATLYILLIIAPLGIWYRLIKIHRDNRKAADEICKRLDAIITATGGRVPSRTGTSSDTPERPRTGGGAYSSTSKGWNR